MDLHEDPTSDEYFLILWDRAAIAAMAAAIRNSHSPKDAVRIAAQAADNLVDVRRQASGKR